MSTTVSYKGETLTTVSNATKTLQTEGKYLEDDITLTDVSGGGAVLGTKNITANGTYEAEDDSLDGYSEVTVAVPASAVDSGTKNITANGNGQDVVGYAAVDVAVPNSYSAGDEGKVVNNGALVAQTSDTVTTNDTYDTTLINSLTVNVSGGGGGIPLPTGWTQLDYADTTGSCAVDTGMKFLYPSTGFSFFMKVGVLDASSVQILSTSQYVSGSYIDQNVFAQNALIMMRTGSGFTNKSCLINVGDDVLIYYSYNSSESKGGEIGANWQTGASRVYSGVAAMRDIQAANTNTMKLFAELNSSNNTYATFATVRFYELCYREGGSDVMHLYPVKDNNGVICLYDTVSETAIYPAVGQFVNNASQLLNAGRILMGVEE